MPGRVFLQRLIKFTIGVKHPNHSIHLTQEVKQGLIMWNHFFSLTTANQYFWRTSCDLRLIKIFLLILLNPWASELCLIGNGRLAGGLLIGLTKTLHFLNFSLQFLGCAYGQSLWPTNGSYLLQITRELSMLSIAKPHKKRIALPHL